MSGNVSSSSGIETTHNYSDMFKKLITKLVDEKTIILEDFIRKNDFAPKEIILENKEDIKNSTEIISEILQSLITEIKLFERDSDSNSKLIDRSIREAKEKIVDKFEFIVDSSVNKELNAMKSVLDAFLIDLRKLDGLKELENLKSLDILKKLESLESLDKLQDLDKLKDLSYIENLQELSKLEKLQKLDGVDFDEISRILSDVNINSKKISNNIVEINLDTERILDLSKFSSKSTEGILQECTKQNKALELIYEIIEKLPQGYVDILETVRSNREMVVDKISILEESVINQIAEMMVQSEVRLMDKICESQFVEVFDKKELPKANTYKDRKAIVYGGLTGSTLYKSNGIKWIKI